MKKAENIIKECEHDGSYIPVNEVLRLIKAAKEEVIKETVKVCYDNSRLLIKDPKKPYTEEMGFYNHKNGSIIGVSQESILSVADKLIKEL
jgi:hypothetical protein